MSNFNTLSIPSSLLASLPCPAAAATLTLAQRQAAAANKVAQALASEQAGFWDIGANTK